MTEAQILAWGGAHPRRTRRWPGAGSGPVQGAPGRHWGTIDKALRDGVGGLPGRDSLAKFLDRHRRPSEPGGQCRWTPGEDYLLRTLPPKEVARRTGRSLKAVYM